MNTELIQQITPAEAALIAHKRWLRPHEALFYTGLARSTAFRKFKEYGIRVNRNGFYDKNEIDKMMAGEPTKFETSAKQIKVA